MEAQCLYSKLVRSSLELPVEASAVEDAGDESPEEDLREEDVEEDADPGGVPHLHEHVLPHPVNLQACVALID